MPDYSTPLRGEQYIFDIGLVSLATGGIQNNPTVVAGDFKVSKDGGVTFVNLTTLPVVNGRVVRITLSATEMAADNLEVLGVDPDGEWNDYMRSIQPADSGVSAWKRATNTLVKGTVGVGSTSTNIVVSSLDPSLVDTNQFKGLVLKFDKNTTTAGLRGQGTDITAASGSTITVTALTQAPVSGDTFVIA